MARNVLLTIKYDGTGFSGWQRQPGKRTVCGELETAFSRLLSFDVLLDAASRTDAGVHAFGQSATLRGDFGIPAERIPRAVNDLLARNRLECVGEIEVGSARDMPDGFHARFNAKGKRYIYKISNAEETDIFKRNYFYQITRPLDIEKMRSAAEHIIGEHDFICFMSAGGNPGKTTVRTVCGLEIDGKPGSEIEISISGDGFLYNMVRNICGTLVEVGLSMREPESTAGAIASKKRCMAGHTAPPQGLYLKEVFY